MEDKTSSETLKIFPATEINLQKKYCWVPLFCLLDFKVPDFQDTIFIAVGLVKHIYIDIFRGQEATFVECGSIQLMDAMADLKDPKLFKNL